MKGRLSYLHPITQIILLILIAFFSFFVFMIVGSVLAIPIFGLDVFKDMFNGNMQSTNGSFLKFLQILQGIGFFIVPALLTAMLISDRPMRYLSFDKKLNVKSVLLTIVLIYAIVPLINLTGMWNAHLKLPEFLSGVENWMMAREEQASGLTELLVKSDNISQLLVNLVMIAVIPAVGEELFFRGIIQTALTRWTRNYHWAIWVAAFVFSFFHLQFYGFLPRMILGVVFGYLLVWSGTIWLPILAHFLNNATAVLAYHYIGKEALSFNPETFGTESQYGWIAILSLLIVIALLFAIRIYEFKKKVEVDI